jgi:release factor glutamine methyltransferase
MSVPLSSPARSAIVTRLRAAGCVFAEDEARLLIAAASTPADLDAMVARRAAGLPLEQVIGWAEFCGLRIAVEPGVFVPRRRTEFLVREAIALARRAAAPPAGRAAAPAPAGRAAAPPAGQAAAPLAGRATAEAVERLVVVDLCCGSGAIGAAVAAGLREIELHAADVDPVAVACARRNLAAAGGRVYQGDLFEPLPAALRGRVGLLLANVPYIPADEIALLPPEARLHEPRTALDGGRDGLRLLRRVAAAAPRWLAPGGHLLIEISERQAPDAASAFTGAGLVPRVAGSEELSATVIIGTRPPAAPTSPDTPTSPVTPGAPDSPGVPGSPATPASPGRP